MAAYTMDQLRQSNKMDPSMTSALQSRPMPTFPPDNLQKRAARAAHLRQLRHLMPVPGPIPSQVTEQDIYIPAEDGYQIHAVHYKPAVKSPSSSGDGSSSSSNNSSNGPLVILFHEGGWTKGDLSDEEFNARLLTRDLGLTCLNVEYRLAPEHPFPTGITDAWTAVKYAAANAASLSADPTKGFVVGGSSAGGNFAAVVAHLSRTEKLDPPVTAQWLSVPYLIPSASVPDRYRDEFISVAENVFDPVIRGPLGPAADRALAELTGMDFASPLASVVAAGIYPPVTDPAEVDLRGEGKGPQLARAFFQVAGLDPLRDHALVYDRILREEYGVETRVELYPGFGHMFWTNWPEMGVSRKFAGDMLEGFRWLLGMGGESLDG